MSLPPESINALKRHIDGWHNGFVSGGRRAEYINGKMQNIYRENIDMIRVAYWNNAEVTEVTGRERKRRVGELHASRTMGNSASGRWDILGEFRNSRRGSPPEFLRAFITHV